MAVRYAVATGNWSSTSTWDGGTLPTSTDDVYANGFTVTINQNVTVLSIRNESTTGVAAGGTFNITTGGYTINGDIYVGGSTTSNNCINITHSTGTITINGNIFGNRTTAFNGCIALNINTGTTSIINVTGTIRGGTTSANLSYGISISACGTLNIIGDIYGGAGHSSNDGIRISGATIALNITGNLYGLSQATALFILQSVTCTITGNVDGRTSTSLASVVIVSYNGAILNLIGNCYGSDNNLQRGINTDTNVTITINGSAIGGLVGNGINIAGGNGIVTVTNAVANSTNAIAGVNNVSSTAKLVVTNAIFGTNGQVPLAGFVRFSNTNNNTIQVYKQDNTTVTLTDAAAYPTQVPIPANVRKGTSYLLGSKVGTLEVPNSSSVAYGVPVDNTTGVAALRPEDVWNLAVSNIINTGSIGDRLKNCSTVETTGAQLASF